MRHGVPVRFTLIIGLTMALWSCTRHPETAEDLLRYVKSPAKGDWTCRDGIKRAEEEIANGKVVFTQEIGFLYGFIRHERELKSLCKSMGIEFDYDARSCIWEDGQTEGCYSATMDNELIERFGRNFRTEMLKKADSLFLHNVQTNGRIVDYYNCDEEPTSIADFKASLQVDQFPIRKKEGPHGGWPFVDMDFVIELDSSIGSFEASNFLANDSSNIPYKNRLIKLAKNYLIQEYPKWNPGRINSIPVRTRHNVRIFFIKE